MKICVNWTRNIESNRYVGQGKDIREHAMKMATPVFKSA
jgi:hypothetical protein